jgi:plastocyanin
MRCALRAIAMMLGSTSAACIDAPAHAGRQERRPSEAATPGEVPPSSTPGRTGARHEVRIVSDSGGAHFEPSQLTIGPGEAVRFVLAGTVPANVAFFFDSLSPDMRLRLSANMSSQMMALAGPLLLVPRAEYTVSFEGLEAGRYPFYSVPQAAAGMRGVITVR